MEQSIAGGDQTRLGGWVVEGKSLPKRDGYVGHVKVSGGFLQGEAEGGVDPFGGKQGPCCDYSTRYKRFCIPILQKIACWKWYPVPDLLQVQAPCSPGMQ
jgi:hypothetical protein